MTDPTTKRTAQNIEQLFNTIAPTYDSLNHWLSLGVDKIWRRRSLRYFVDKRQAQHILDIACGTGDFSIAIAQHAHPDSFVQGLDLTEGMLEVMQQKIAQKGLAHCIAAEQGNSEQMRFADSSFDCATIAFGIRNFEHRERALQEILRVLKPGGQLVILELSVPASPLLQWCYKLYFTRLLPLIGGMISGDKAAYRYLPASVIAFPNKKEWIATMGRCGYSNVCHKAFSLGICRMYIGEKTL